MKKTLTTLLAATALAAAVASTPAEARHRGNVALGIIGGIAAGAIIAGALQGGYYGPYYDGPYYYGPPVYVPGPYYYGPSPVYYGAPCTWQRERVRTAKGWRVRTVRVCY